jgi:phage terminase large subunit
LGLDGVFRLQTPEVFLPLLEKGPKYKGARGGRGSGKSHFFGESLIEEALDDPYLRAVCIREVQRTLAQSSKRLIEDKIRKLKVGHRFDITDKVIHILDDGGERCGVIIFEGMQNHTADSIKSLEGFRICWVEEAQSLSQRSLDLLYPTIREKGGEIWFSWNPKKATDPVEKFMTGEDAASDPAIVVVEANYHDNPWFWATELVDDMERDRRRDPDKYAHIWLGAYLKRSEATVFKNWRIAVFETPDVVERFLFGADWGFSVDPSVLVRGFLGRLIERGKDAHGNDVVTAIPDQRGNTLFIDAEAYKVGCEIDYLPALFAGNAPPKHGREWENPYGWRGIPGALRWPITADSARPETISYMKRAGFNIRPALKGPGSLEDGIEFLRNYDIVVLPTCVHVIDELSLYSYKVDKITDEVLPELADKENHCLVAGTRVRTQRGEVAIEDVMAGDLVEGSLGYRRVLFSGVTGTRRTTLTIETTLGSFVCTPDHEVYTQRGFVRADCLRYTDEVFGGDRWSRPRNSWDGLTGAIRRVIASRIASISAARSAGNRISCIGTSGSIITGPFQMDGKSITRTRTPVAMRSRIWSACLPRSTSDATLTLRNGVLGRSSIWTGYGISPRRGTRVLRGMRRIAELVAWPTSTLFLNPSLVTSAGGPSFQRESGTRTGSVRMPASQRFGVTGGSMTSNGSALSAERRSSSIDTARRQLVRGRVLSVSPGPMADEVYDLTVEDTHDFFANGVLVSNCIDALRYAVEGLRRGGLRISDAVLAKV